MTLLRISSLDHPIVKRIVKLRVDSDFRRKESSVIIEGLKPVQEVCRHIHTHTLIVSDRDIPLGLHAQKMYQVDARVMKKLSGMQSSEGILAEVEMPKPASLHDCHFIIALDGINDPANIGILLRTALALGWEGAFILNNSCDPYNEKALRAARGATFRLPIARGDWSELQKLTETHAFQSFVATIDKAAIPVKRETNIPKSIKYLLVLGNEAHGASKEALALCRKIMIPMPGEMESLNVSVAGGILMHFLRQV